MMKKLNSKIVLATLTLIIFGSYNSFSQNDELNTELMKSTFKIEGKSKLGTVFILKKPLIKDTTKFNYILITADHVLTDIKEDTAIIFLRKKNIDESYSRIHYKIQIRSNGQPTWLKHPSADVAVMNVTLPDYAEINLGLNFLVGDDIFERFEIHPGDNLMCLGYPLGQDANDIGFPILRNGIISSYPLVPSRITRSFLMDVEVFKGNSGGPVYFVQYSRWYNKAFRTGRIQFIAGLISHERLRINETKNPYTTVREEQQLGLAIVVPSSFILETINQLPN